MAKSATFSRSSSGRATKLVIMTIISEGPWSCWHVQSRIRSMPRPSTYCRSAKQTQDEKGSVLPCTGSVQPLALGHLTERHGHVNRPVAAAEDDCRVSSGL